LEASWTAIRHQVSVARGGEQRAVHDDMLDGLEGCAALAGDLVWSVLGEESLRVFPGKGVSCNDPVKSRVWSCGYCSGYSKTRRDSYVRMTGFATSASKIDGTTGLPQTFHIIMPSGDAYTVFFGLRLYFFCTLCVQKLRRFSPWPLKYAVRQRMVFLCILPLCFNTNHPGVEARKGVHIPINTSLLFS
jgi:hypothetical protein